MESNVTSLPASGRATARRQTEKACRAALDATVDSAPVIFNEKQARAYCGNAFSLAFLRDCRCYGNRKGRADGPKFLKIGKMVFYKRSDLDAWIEQHVVNAPEA